MKKDKWEKFGGGGSRQLQFTKGNEDFPVLKASGKTLNISIGAGLPPDSSKLKFFVLVNFSFSFYMQTKFVIFQFSV